MSETNTMTDNLPPLRPKGEKCRRCGTRSQVTKRQIATEADGKPVGAYLCRGCYNDIDTDN